MNDKMQLWSQASIAKVISPFYPFGEKHQQDKIVVVLVNGRSLDLISQLPEAERLVYANEWPILYKDHAHILKSIVANSSPKQIFIDIEFHKIRNTDDTFPEFIRILKKVHNKKGVQFTHAIGGKGQQIPEEINQQFMKFSSPVMNAWPDDFMPLQQTLKSGQAYLSPALKMYANLKKEPIRLSDFDQDMFVYWRNSYDKSLFSKNEVTQCLENDNHPFIEFITMFAKGIAGRSEHDRCYPERVVFLDELQQMVSQGAEGKAKIKSIFDNATVLYGTDYIALGDRYDSPTHGTIPGIFYHAMALDNLLEFNREYFKSYSTWLDVAIWAVLSIILIMIYVLRETLSWFKSHKVVILCVLVLYLLALLVLTIWTRWAPANFISLFGLIGTAWFLSNKEGQCNLKKESAKK